ncbi:MAG: zf-HC2 domain-containing protein, partial [Acidimicrobiales bacterium]
MARVLQFYLDGEIDEVTAQRVAVHLEACRRCGMEAAAYVEIRSALRRRALATDVDALGRLRAFAQRLARDDPGDTAEQGHR